MISFVAPLKTRPVFALDSGQVKHIANGVVIVWSRGRVVKWGYFSMCHRVVESHRLMEVDYRPCRRCAKEWAWGPTPVKRYQVPVDWFELFKQAEKIGVFV